MFNKNSLLFGGAMATGDSIVLSTLRAYSLGYIKSKFAVVLAMIFYSLQPLIFLKSLAYESLTVMNLMWDVMSDVSVTIIGLFYFKEKISIYKKIGVLFSVISIMLLTYEDGEIHKLNK
jgi:drug/metabolite transporter (DMT)-like permease